MNIGHKLLQPLIRLRLPAGWSALALMAALAVVMLSTRPVWSPPPEFDAHGYIAMAEHPLQKQVDVRQQQRVFPALVVHAVAYATGADIRDAFQMVAHADFLIFAALLFVLLYRAGGQDGLLAAALVLQLLLSSWLITYNLSMIYQVSDMLTYVFTAALLLAVTDRRWALFWVLSVPAILTRQNLAVLVVAAAAMQMATRLRRPRLRPGRLILILFPFLLLCGFVGAWCLAHEHMFVRLLRTEPAFLRQMLLNVIELSLPFTMVLAGEWRSVCKFFRLHWPLALFCAITIYQPHSYFFHTGQDNALRIAMQGVWVINLAACLAIVKRMQTGPVDGWRRALMLAFPVIWVGIRGLEQLQVWPELHWVWPVKLLAAGVLALALFRARGCDRPA